MYRFLRLSTALLLTLLVLAGSSQAITRVAQKLNVISFSAGYAQPTGSYTGIPPDQFILDGQSFEFDGDEVYDGAFFIGAEYGQVWSRHFLFSIGLRYTNHNLKDTIGNTFTYDWPPSLHQFDFDINLNLLAMDLQNSPFSPYLGIGLHPGFTTATWKEFDSQTDVTFAMSLNFGAEVKVYSAPSGRSFVTLASMNNWNFVGTNDRPKYLHIGGGLKYYFRP